jgi:cysteinyl-tRNA synthetase
MSPPMTISLYDPGTDSLRELVAGISLRSREGSAPLDPPVLAFGPTLGASASVCARVAALRSRVLHDVLLRILPLQRYEPDAGLASELAAAVEGELEAACEAETLRYFSLTAHYRAPLSLLPSRTTAARVEGEDEDSAALPPLDDSERRLAYFYAAKKRLDELPGERIINVQTAPAATLATLPDGLTQALERDLDTPLALAELQEFAIAVNALCDQALRKKGRVNLSAVQSARAGFTTIEGLLGLGGDDPAAFLLRVRNRRAARRKLDVSTIDRTVSRRVAARAQQDFATADRLQAELLALGVTLLDGAEGTTWTLI